MLHLVEGGLNGRVLVEQVLELKEYQRQAVYKDDKVRNVSAITHNGKLVGFLKGIVP